MTWQVLVQCLEKEPGRPPIGLRHCPHFDDKNKLTATVRWIHIVAFFLLFKITLTSTHSGGSTDQSFVNFVTFLKTKLAKYRVCTPYEKF